MRLQMHFKPLNKFQVLGDNRQLLAIRHLEEATGNIYLAINMQIPPFVQWEQTHLRILDKLTQDHMIGDKNYC